MTYPGARVFPEDAGSVLIVEDALDNRLLLQRLCEAEGLRGDAAADGNEALGLIKQGRRYPVYVVDLMMPGMDGEAFLRELRILQPDAVVLVQTALDEHDAIVRVMKAGAFDYFVKPFDRERFRTVLLRALEFAYLRKQARSRDPSEEILRGQLEWLSYKEARMQGGAESVKRNALRSLRSALGESGRVEASIALIRRLRDAAVFRDDRCEVPRQLIDSLKRNNEFTRRLLQGLAYIEQMTARPLELAPISARECLGHIPERCQRAADFAQHQGIQLNFPDTSRLGSQADRCILNVNQKHLYSALEELMINACKYSPSQGSVDVFAGLGTRYCRLSVHNRVGEGFFGVPVEYASLVMEPFFRRNAPVPEAGRYELFGAGMGLSAVQYVVNAHGGRFQITDAQDHTGDRVANVVVAEIALPVLEATP